MRFNQGQYAEARDAYARAVDADPEDPGARVLLGNALIELHDYDAAREQFERALELDPDAPEAHRGLMTIVSHTAAPGDSDAFARFLAHAEALVAARPEDKNALINAGIITSEAANPADPDAYAKAQAKAESYLRRALKIDDRDPKLLFHLVVVYARKGEVAVGERVVDRIRAVQPEAGLADYAAAVLYALAGARDRALASVEALLANADVDPDSLLARTSYLASLHGDAEFQALIAEAKRRRQ